MLMVRNTKVNGKTINRREMGLNNGQMEHRIKDNTCKVRNKVQVCLNGLMVHPIKVTFITIQ
jgi:hypothetical protein